MLKNVVIAVLVLATGFCIVQARNKADEAQIQKLAALENYVLALENAEKAKKAEQKAVESAAMARIHQRRAEELSYELGICK